MAASRASFNRFCSTTSVIASLATNPPLLPGPPSVLMPYREGLTEYFWPAPNKVELATRAGIQGAAETVNGQFFYLHAHSRPHGALRRRQSAAEGCTEPAHAEVYPVGDLRFYSGLRDDVCRR